MKVGVVFEVPEQHGACGGFTRGCEEDSCVFHAHEGTSLCGTENFGVG